MIVELGHFAAILAMILLRDASTATPCPTDGIRQVGRRSN